MKNMDNLQIVDVDRTAAPCERCGVDLLDIGNIIYTGENHSEATYYQEIFICRHCGIRFAHHYAIFNDEGCIIKRVFAEDMNDASDNWQDHLTVQQKEAVAAHMQNCPTCQDKMSQSICDNARIKSFIKILRKKVKKI